MFPGRDECQFCDIAWYWQWHLSCLPASSCRCFVYRYSSSSLAMCETCPSSRAEHELTSWFLFWLTVMDVMDGQHPWCSLFWCRDSGVVSTFTSREGLHESCHTVMLDESVECGDTATYSWHQPSWWWDNKVEGALGSEAWPATVEPMNRFYAPNSQVTKT